MDRISQKSAEKLREFAKALAKEKFGIELIGAKEAEAIFKKRVFNEGKNTAGKKMVTKSKNRNAKSGVYSHPYGMRRKKGIKIGSTVYKGRRNDVMDNQLTGSLFQSIQVIEDNGVPTLKITNGKLSKIAGYLEEQQQAEIYTIGKTEKAQVKKAMALALNKQIKKLLKS